jgi:hypothetical protein
MRNLIGAVLLGIAIPVVGFAQCAANGLTLVEQGNRLGDWFSVSLTGTPGVPGLLGVDIAAGPLTSPIGTLCIGQSSALQLLPFTLDPAGHYLLTGILPPSPALNGTAVYLQAAAIDPAQPNGSALSNGRTLTLRPPRVYFIQPGNPSPLFPIVPGSWCAYDLLTDSVLYGPVPLAFPVRDVVAIPSLDWIAFTGGFGNGADYIQCFDANTGLPTLSILPAPGSFPNKLAVIGKTLYVMRSGTPPGLDAYALPSGATVFSTNLVGTASPQKMILAPDAGVAYLHSDSVQPLVPAIHVVNLTTGLQLPSIPLNDPHNPTEWLVQGNTLYLMWQVGAGQLFGSPALQSIDTTTQLPLQPAPVFLPWSGVGSKLRYGPGQFGNCLFLTVPQAQPSLIQVNPVTLAPINQVQGSFGWLTDMVLSPGGTEWLMVGCPYPPFGCSPSLSAMQVPSMTVSPLGPVPVSPFSQPLFSIPSTTLRRAFIASPGFMAPFSTDPATPPVMSIPIPFPNARVLID